MNAHEELTNNPEFSDEDIQYGSEAYWERLYVFDGKLSEEEQKEATELGVKKYLSEVPDETFRKICSFMGHGNELYAGGGQEFSDAIRHAANLLIATGGDFNRREEGLFLQKQLDKINLDIQRYRRNFYDAMLQHDKSK